VHVLDLERRVILNAYVVIQEFLNVELFQQGATSAGHFSLGNRLMKRLSSLYFYLPSFETLRFPSHSFMISLRDTLPRFFGCLGMLTF
jgi:hypothetical protein